MPRHSRRVPRKRIKKQPDLSRPSAHRVKIPKLRESHNPAVLLEQYQETVRLLAQSDALNSGNLLQACQAITEACSHLLQVERASIWFFTKDRAAISLMDLFESSANRHSAQMVIHSADYPTYFRALAKEERAIA